MRVKYIKRMFSPNITGPSYFLITWQSFHRKRAKSLEGFFLQLWKCNLFDSIEISGTLTADLWTTNIENVDPILVFLSSNRQFFVSDPRGS